MNRIVPVLLGLEQLQWPDAEERKHISSTIQQVFGFPGCVGITDGTLIPLAFRPTANPEDYWTRKGSFAVNALITCDHLARMRHVVIGWPGCVHDNRVFRNSSLNTKRRTHFSYGEYLLGDSAFKASNIMVPAFKKTPGAEMGNDKKRFNTMLARVRIRSEHSIGLLKARFPYFRTVRMRIRARQDMKKLADLFLCAVMIHNLLIDTDIPSQWRAAIEEYSRLNEVVDSEPYEPAIDSTSEREEGQGRREEVFRHVMEHFSSY